MCDMRGRVGYRVQALSILHEADESLRLQVASGATLVRLVTRSSRDIGRSVPVFRSGRCRGLQATEGHGQTLRQFPRW